MFPYLLMQILLLAAAMVFWVVANSFLQFSIVSHKITLEK